MTPAISRGSFLVGLLVFGSLMIGLPRFIDTPLWLIVLGSLLNAAFYVALVELVLSRIRQAAMFQFDDGGP
jgi:hypothetical protein